MVTLISPYHGDDSQTTADGSSASSSSTASDTDDMHLGNLVLKLIQIILRSRIGADSCACQQDHHFATSNTRCYLMDPLSPNMEETSEWELALRILHNNTLLERWNIHFNPRTVCMPKNEHVSSSSTTTTTTTTTTFGHIILLLQSVYSHTRLLPVESLLHQLMLRKSDLGFLLTTSDTTKLSLGCHSFLTNDYQPTDFDKMNDFGPHASLASHSFSTVDCIDIEGQLSIHVMYDQTIDKLLLSPRPLQLPFCPVPEPPTQDGLCPRHDEVVVPEYKKLATVGLSPFSGQQNVPAATTLPSQRQPPLIPSSNINSYIGMRRLSRLSLSALHDEEDASELPPQQHDDHKPHTSLVIPLSTSPIQYTHHGHTLAYSTSPSTNYQHQRRLSLPHQHSHHHGLVGSYEESLLSGRMSTLLPSRPIWFHAQIGVLGHGRVKPALRWPAHRSASFPAYFYDGGEETSNTSNGNMDDTGFISMTAAAATAPSIPPYVGAIDLTVDGNGAPSKGYRIPSQGQLQITIKNPHKSLVKLFLVPYDVSKMPRGTKTFLRQKSYAPLRLRSQSLSTPNAAAPEQKSSTKVIKTALSPVPPPSSTPLTSSTPKYIIHLQLCRTEKNRVFLYNKIRVVFANRCMNPGEPLTVVYDGPKEPTYSPLGS